MTRTTAPRIVPLLRESYLAAIKNSASSKTFKNFFATVDGKRQDILKDGKLSCAFFVSFVLFHFGLLKKPHTTVEGTVKDMENSGWEKTRMSRPGNVLVWEAENDDDSERHAHIGFDLGNGKAISNSSKKRMPVIHSRTFGGKRKIVAMYQHPSAST
ncbi:MAG: hypothetical protein WA001_01375 [Patescibacteria group bacterium]